LAPGSPMISMVWVYSLASTAAHYWPRLASFRSHERWKCPARPARFMRASCAWGQGRCDPRLTAGHGIIATDV
jgi:hypothetical protein